MRDKIFNLTNLLYLALVLALFASLNHVAYAFSTVNGGNLFEAYVSAVAIDLGLLALAAGINKRKAEDRPIMWLWFGVALFSVISAYANWLAGISHVAQLNITVGFLGSHLIVLRPILLSAVLPALVIFLSEVVSGDHQVAQNSLAHQLKQFTGKTQKGTPEWVQLRQLIWLRDEKSCRGCGKSLANGSYHCHHIVPEARGGSSKPNNLVTLCENCHDTIHTKMGDKVFDNSSAMEALELAHETKQKIIVQRQEQLKDLMDQGLSQAEMASELGVSLSTVKRDLKAVTNGHQNGSDKGDLSLLG